MSDKPISISDLLALREGWPESITPVFGLFNEWDGEFDHSNNEHGDEGYLECSSLRMDCADLFAKLVAAEHNAMPVLLEVVKAALAWSEQRAQDVHDALMRPEEEIEAESVEVRRARVKRTADLAMAIERALSRVTP